VSIGLRETLKAVTDNRDCLVFVIHDKEHQDTNGQLLAACRQQATSHYVLPKFSKVELCKIFGVRRLTCFAVCFEKTQPGLKAEMQTALSGLD